jgi:hypothetical protein
MLYNFMFICSTEFKSLLLLLVEHGYCSVFARLNLFKKLEAARKERKSPSCDENIQTQWSEIRELSYVRKSAKIVRPHLSPIAGNGRNYMHVPLERKKANDFPTF